MHRSGTSLVGSLLAAQGIEMGQDLLRADRLNPHGYYEDLDFLTLQRHVLAAAVAHGEGGHPDWGWVERGELAPAALAAGAGEARALVAERRARGRPWGWKDPRTSMLLEWWDEILAGDARYLLVYREPWEVADSIQRSGAAVWVDNPGYAARIWCTYNEHVLRFHAAHRDRALLVSTRALVAEPERFAALAAARLDLDIPAATVAARRDPELLRALGPDDPLPALWLRTHPEAAWLLDELERRADLASGIDWSPRPSRLAPRAGVTLSVVIPCFDMGELLVDAIASVERTAPDGCELLVVDDGSREEATCAILGAVEDHGYRVLRQENGGLAAARNHGFAHAGGRYLLPLDADNRLLAGFVADAIAVLDRDATVGVVYGDRTNIGVDQQTVALAEMDAGAFLWCNWIDACAVMRREVWEASGGYDAGAAVWEDWELWISALERGWRFHHLRRPTFEYRVRPASMLREVSTERARAVWQHIVRKHPDLYRRHLEDVVLAGQSMLLESQRYARRLLNQILVERSARAEADREAVAAVERELAATRDELERLRHRVDFMRSTRAWRWRRALLGLRGRPPES